VASHESRSQTALRTVVDNCCTANPNAKNLREDQLAAFNKLMVSLRVRARTAPLSVFHRFLQRACGEQRVVQCLTTSWDGLETRGMTNVNCDVIQAHGDNRWLRCCTPACSGLSEDEAAQLDEKLLLGETVSCPPCTQAGWSHFCAWFRFPFCHRSIRVCIFRVSFIFMVAPTQLV
jgi:NAD-dependent SIR2 family protein deacetylase